MNTQSLASVELKLEVLNKKFDEMIDLFKKTMTLLEKKKREQPSETETIWSMSDYNNKGIDYVLVSFSFNVAFKNYIKELGGIWMISKKAWMFPKSNEADLIEKISTQFPSWTKQD